MKRIWKKEKTENFFPFRNDSLSGSVFLASSGDNLFVGNGNMLLRWDLKAKNLVWIRTFKEKINNGIYTNEKMVICMAYNCINAVDVEKGDLVWTFRTDDMDPYLSAPLFHNGRCLFVDYFMIVEEPGEFEKKWNQAERSGRTGKVMALDCRSGKLLWSRKIAKTGFALGPAALLDCSRVVFSEGGQNIRCVKPGNGDTVFVRKGPQNGILQNPVACGDRFYCLGMDECLYEYSSHSEATDIMHVPGCFYAVGAIREGKQMFYMLGNRHVRAVDTYEKKTIWHTELKTDRGGNILVAGERVVVEAGCHVFIMDIQTGAMLHVQEFEENLISNMVSTGNNTIHAICESGNLYSIMEM